MRFVVTNHIANLKNKIPGITDSAGRDILFDTCELKIIESDITNKAIHTVALIYTTPVLTLIDNIGDTLLLSPGNKSVMLKAL